MVWFWVALWFVLVAGAVTVLALLGLRLWRKSKALTAEAGAVTDRLAEISAAMTDPAASPRTDSPVRP